jgi:preprotein translocase subunit SecG
MRGGLLGGLGIAIGILALIYLALAAVFSVTTATSVFFVLVSVVMVLGILIQKPKGGGLAAAFGGGGGGDQAMFGAKVGDVMTWVTVVLFIAFLGLAVALVYTTGAEDSSAPAPAWTSPVDPGPGQRPAPGGDRPTPPTDTPDAPDAPDTSDAPDTPDTGGSE